jgi:hypothetical protein
MERVLHDSPELGKWEWFDTPQDLLKSSQAACGEKFEKLEKSGHLAPSWLGGSVDDIVTKTRNGCPKMSARVEKLANEISITPPVESRIEWQDDVTGACPNVPNYLTGCPLTMQNEVETRSPLGELTILVNISASAGVSPAKYEAKAAAIAAVIRQLSAIRPVRLLYVASHNVGNGQYITFVGQIETRPFGLSELYCLASAGFYRLVALLPAITKLNSNSGYITWTPWEKTMLHTVRDIVGLSTDPDNVLYIGPTNFYDPESQKIQADPRKWVLETVERFSKVSTEL